MMRKTMISTALALLMLSCNDVDSHTPANNSLQAKADASPHKPDFSQITFASKKDTTCGMPLTAGIEDTLHLDGKVYGFCSRECKDGFVKTLTAKK